MSADRSAWPPEKLNLVAGPAASIDHSRWTNALHYLAALTTVLIVFLGLAIHFDKPALVVSTLT